ncbi:nudC domain-containing protein 3 [Lissotriton helveticus]
MEPTMTDRYDQALLGILQHVGNIQEFLNIYFGFLYRKTDFYRLLLTERDRMGFPPGVARSMVMKAFKSFEHLAQQDHELRVKNLEQTLKKQLDEELPEASPAPQSAQDIVVETVTESVSVPAESATIEATASAIQPSAICEEPVAEQATSSLSSEASGSAEGSNNEEPTSIPRKQDQFQRNPESYNGAVRENYVWSQDYNDLEIKVPVPKEIKKGKQVSVDLRSTSIRVAMKEGSSERVLMEGTLTHKINTETSLWSLEPGKCVVINLSKNGEYWWNAILEGEEKIDIEKINKERSMAAIDDEEHAVLDRLSYDYHQKLQGKPQSHETKVHEMLKKGWDAEGSPFRGQAFDPSMFNISPGAVQF